MATKLFVGGLDFSMTDDKLKDMFAEFGTVESAQIISDRATNRSKGFGFVELDSEEAAKAAIAAMNGKNVSGRSLTVNIAKPREERPAGRSFGPRNDFCTSMSSHFRQSRR